MHPSRLFSLQQKAPVKSAAGLGRGPTLFSVINGQSVISKFGRPFILDSFSPETASRFRSEIRLTFVRSDFATRSGGNRRFRKASESVPRSRSGKCPCSYCSYFCMTSSHQDLRRIRLFPRKCEKCALGSPRAAPSRDLWGALPTPKRFRDAYASSSGSSRHDPSAAPRPTHARPRVRPRQRGPRRRRAQIALVVHSLDIRA